MECSTNPVKRTHVLDTIFPFEVGKFPCHKLRPIVRDDMYEMKVVMRSVSDIVSVFFLSSMSLSRICPCRVYRRLSCPVSS